MVGRLLCRWFGHDWGYPRSPEYYGRIRLCCRCQFRYVEEQDPLTGDWHPCPDLDIP